MYYISNPNYVFNVFRAFLLEPCPLDYVAKRRTPQGIALTAHLLDSVDEVHQCGDPFIGRQWYSRGWLSGPAITWLVIGCERIDFVAKSAGRRLRISHLV